MTLKLFSVYDEKAKCFRFPHFSTNSGTAIRSFTEGCNDSQNEISKYPIDFTLFEHGSWDDLTGVFENLVAPVNLGNATQYKAIQNKEA